MARLTALPSIDIIKGFHGVLDFYMWKGLPCVRAWPRGKGLHRSDAEIASAALFGAVIKAYSLLGHGALEAYQDMAIDNPRTARDIMVSGVLGHLHERTIPEPPPPPEEEMYDAYLCLRDLKPQNTHGGSFTAGAWRTRDLTEEQADPHEICTLAANQFILAPGTYRCLISCPCLKVGLHTTRLYNVTGAVALVTGTSERADSTDLTSSRAVIAGRFTVAAAQTLEIQHRGQLDRATYGFGWAANLQDEIYTVAEFWREIEEE